MEENVQSVDEILLAQEGASARMECTYSRLLILPAHDVSIKFFMVMDGTCDSGMPRDCML